MVKNIPNINKILIVILMISAVFIGIGAQAVEEINDGKILKEKFAEEQSSLVLTEPHANVSNNYIAIVVARSSYTGTYTMGTTGGDPTRTGDNNKLLLYGYPNPRTSYLTVRIDGVNYVTRNGEMNSYWISGPNVVGTNSIVTKWQIGSIGITQTTSIITSSTTGYEDTGLFKIKLINNGSTSRSVGARFMFDTMLGSNDAAPFQVPGLGNITTEREFSSSNMPRYWQAFDSLSNPTVISQGTLATSTPPDRFILANWGNLYNAPWDYTVRTGSTNGDSAAAAYWFPVTLAGGDTVEYSTAYGLGGITFSSGVLKLGVTAPLNVTSSTGSFTVTSYVENTGQTTANVVSANISLPSALSLASGETQTKSLGNLTAGAVGITSWVAKANGIPGTYNYSVAVSSQNTNSTTVYRNITVPESVIVKIAENYTVAVNGTKEVPVELLIGSNVAGGTFTIGFDTSIVKVDSVSAGDFMTPLANVDNVNGTVKIAVARSDAVGMSNSTLAIVTFKGVADGTSILDVKDPQLNDANGNLVTPTEDDGKIIVGGGTCVLNGDLNHNGILDTGDATMILRKVVGLD